jgi:hypothetical protein
MNLHTKPVVAIGVMSSNDDAIARRLRWTVMAVAFIAILGGAVGMAVVPRSGILSVAVVLGWTQMAGL